MIPASAMIALGVIVALLFAGAVITLVGSLLIERAHPPRGRRIKIGGLSQHIVELGAETGGRTRAPIVLLHGAGCNLEDLRELGERLAGRHRVILVDRPGQGWSEARGRQSSSPAYQAAILRDVLDRLGVGRAIVVGHSWGGTLALAFALDYPDRAAGLALLAPPTHPRLHGMIRLYSVLAAPFFGWLFARTLVLPLAVLAFAPGVRGSFLPQAPPPHYLKRSAAFLLLRPKTFLANARDIAGLPSVLARQATRYRTLKTTAVIVTGERDGIVPPREHAMALAAAIPRAKLVVLPGVGHMPHHAAAERIVAEIEELIVKANSE
jgi:pimeloyl-ACP methyl ester carboxylesterase